MVFKVISVIGYALMVAPVIPLYFRGGLFSANPVTIAIQVLAAAVLLWARITFGKRSFHFAANPTEGGLVTSGPYRFLRHPIYASVIWAVWAGAIANWNIINGILAFTLTAGGVIRMVSEERLLRVRYPEYEDYARRTRRVIPFVL
jgi:protein-S-isoprenylcysteine O-methyltransferase Ste14